MLTFYEITDPVYNKFAENEYAVYFIIGPYFKEGDWWTIDARPIKASAGYKHTGRLKSLDEAKKWVEDDYALLKKNKGVRPVEKKVEEPKIKYTT